MLSGRIALVTGSSRGIGEAIARELARQGACVAVHGRDATAAEQVAIEIREDGATAIALSGDVTSADDLDTLRRRIENGLGPVDVLVANVGGNLAPPAPLEEIEERDWRATIDANLLATFLTVKCFLPGMKQTRPRRDHHHRLLSCPTRRRSHSDPLRGRQSRHRTTHPNGRGPSQPRRNPRTLSCA